MACSTACADSLSRSERAVELILQKHVQGTRTAALFMYASGIVFLTVAVVGYLKEPRMIIGHGLAAAFGVILLIGGAAFHRVAGKRDRKAV